MAQQNQNPAARQTTWGPRWAKFSCTIRNILREQFAGLVNQIGLPFKPTIRQRTDNESVPRTLCNRSTLIVQASSVASESAFSTSGRILSIRRTRLTAESLEMFEEGVFNDEVQMNEATQLTDQEIALDASSDGSFEEPPRDYMLSSGAEDDETQDGAGGSMSHGHGQYTYY
ncbi:zinc finger BED domain-containing protein RICESLEEPER 3 [Tanacetum coccineum]|uniref:Zinc finger BED domain-containing protein RICESLEEPER 3 n=1 Tax=Tanacetum coccineum TaxID=301880 RepID=A0ABQ5C382_9ASTR